MAHILVLEDDLALSAGLCFELDACGHLTVAAYHCEKARQLLEKEAFDLALFDVNLPDGSGFDLCREVKEKYPNLPVLFLTARDDMRDKIQGLTVGGDDYVTKPFGLEEVVARIRAILRRTMGAEEDDAFLRVGDLVIDEDAHEVTRAGVPIDLSPTEFKLLRYLVINAGRVVSKMQILDHVWEYDWDGEVAIVESYISYLRRKLAVEGASGELIHTKRGVGYILRAEE